MVGSMLASRVIEDNMEVVVVLPWVPDTATLYLCPFIISPKNSALSIRGIFKF